MTATRRSFLASGVATTAAAALPVSKVRAAEAGSTGEAPRGLTLTTIRDGSLDHVGIRTAGGIVDVALAARAMGVASPPNSVDDVLAGRGDLAALARMAADPPRSALRSESSIQFGPLVTAPPKILCVGLNYRAHLVETKLKAPAYPDLFNKYNTTLNRHKGTVRVSNLPLSHFDYESELVMYIGKTARNVAPADALGHVFGYSCGNDFSARDAQLRVSQWMTGKTPDEFAPLGPWLVSADQIADPQNLQIQTFVNDEAQPRQDMNTSEMIFNCAQIVSYISQFVTLQPGDVIFTGTPSGVILGYPPEKQLWLKPGDRIRTVISSLGELHFALV